MRLGLLYDLQTDPLDERQAEFDPPAVIDALCEALRQLGHDVERLGDARELLRHPGRTRAVDLVFNIAEGEGSRCREAWAPMLLEMLGVPYIGSDATALAVGLDKAMTKRIAQGLGIATPAWRVVEDAGEVDRDLGLRMPAIVKPRYGGSGMGIDERAVIRDRPSLCDRVARMLATWRQPMLVEEFIAGGELTVCMIGNDPPEALPAIQRPIDPISRLSTHVAPQSRAWAAPLELTPSIDADARAIAIAMFDALGCADMARVDLRVDEDGRVYFLEINPLPSFDPNGSIGLIAEYLNITYAQLIGRIVDAARARLGLASSSTVHAA